jgi:hypothetical protein
MRFLSAARSLVTSLALVSLCGSALAQPSETSSVEGRASDVGDASAQGTSMPGASGATAVPGDSSGEPRRAGALAVGAAVVPGLVVHGSGHFVAGRSRTGYALLAAEGAGLGLLVGGLFALRETGASRRVVAPLALVAVAGGALFVTSALADLYGVVAPEGDRGSPLRIAPAVETQLGARYVYDPTFAYRAFLVEAFDLRWGRIRASPSAWYALDDTNRRLRLELAYRTTGPMPGAIARDGSFVEIEGALVDHDYGQEGFGMLSGEAMAHGRLDLRRLSPDLAGSFVDGGAGAALQSYRYDRVGTEGRDMLLARFGFGFYLGSPPGPQGEVQAFYDHRRDGLAAGLKVPGIGAGYLGSFGLRARYYFGPRWGLLTEAQVGSALLGGVSILFRGGGFLCGIRLLPASHAPSNARPQRS